MILILTVLFSGYTFSPHVFFLSLNIYWLAVKKHRYKQESLESKTFLYMKYALYKLLFFDYFTKRMSYFHFDKKEINE